MDVSGNTAFSREETFEYLRRPDGGIVLLNTITAANGSYRVRVRYDFNGEWHSESAAGLGIYDGVPVSIQMVRKGKQVNTTVQGDGIALNPISVCDPDCFLNMSPSALSMFVMTRHYNENVGGPQTFRWAGQDLNQVRTLSGGEADLNYRGKKTYSRQTLPGRPLRLISVRHYTFVERLPTPDGGTFSLDFDLWTDEDHRPLGFRVTTPGASPTVGFRRGWDGVRAHVLGGE